MDNCVLPVNANITLAQTGVGQMTDVHVSIDLYANNASAVSPAIFHHPKERISTIIRVILPAGFKVCQDEDRILTTLQGGPAGVKGVSGAGGFRQIIAVAKGRITTEVVPGLQERVGKEIGQADPCQPLCLDRVFEMETFHTCDENDPATPAGGDTDDCRPTSSRDPAVPSRLTFTITNVRIPDKRGRNPETGVDGELSSAGFFTTTQFGVQIFKKFIEVRNEQTIPRLTMRYFNNRMNDRLLNHTLLPWFDGTSNQAVILTPNRLWEASASFERQLKNEFTTAMLIFRIASPVPRNGFIRIIFPDSFDVKASSISSVEVWQKAVSTKLLRSLAEPADGLYIGKLGSLTPIVSKASRTDRDTILYKIVGGELWQLFQESGDESEINPVDSEKSEHFFHTGPQNVRTEQYGTNLTVLVKKSAIDRNSHLMVVVKEVKTPERAKSFDFEILTGSDNSTGVLHDRGWASSVELGPNVFGNPSFTLSSYVAGAENVVATFDVTAINRLSRRSKIILRLPRADFIFENGANVTLHDIATSGYSPSLSELTILSESTKKQSSDDYVEIVMSFATSAYNIQCGDGTFVQNSRFCPDKKLVFGIGGFSNRPFAGPSTEAVYIETRGTVYDLSRGSIDDDEAVLDFASMSLSTSLVPSSLQVQSVEFPARASSVGDMACSFTITNPLPRDSEIVLRFPSLFRISPDTEVLGLGDISWGQTRDNDRNITLGSDVWANQAGINEITIYLRRAEGFVQNHQLDITVTRVQSPNFVLTPFLEITTRSYGYEDISSGRSFQVDSTLSTDIMTLPAQEDGVKVTLGLPTAGVLHTIGVDLTTINPLVRNGRITVRFPDDFDVSMASVLPDEVPTTVRTAECNDQLQCRDNSTFFWNETSRQWTGREFTLDAAVRLTFDYAGFGWDGGFDISVTDPSDCENFKSENGTLTCRAKMVTLSRTNRRMSAEKHPAKYVLQSCYSPVLSGCAQRCNEGLNVTVNCTRLSNDTIWVNTSAAGSDIPPGTLVKFYVKGVRNPRYEGPAGVFRVRTTLANGVSVDGNDNVMIPDIVPEIFTVPTIALKDSRAYNDTELSLGFVLSNLLLPGGRIRVHLPPRALYQGLTSSESVTFHEQVDCVNITTLTGEYNNISVTTLVCTQVQEDFTVSYEQDLLVLTRPQGGVPAKNISTKLAVKNRPFAAGDTGAWRVDTQVEAYPGDWRVVAEYTYSALPITTSNFRHSSVTVVALDGDRASNPDPIAGRSLYLRIDLVVNQPIAYPSGKLILDLGDGIILPRPPNEVQVIFDCGSTGNVTVSSCNAAEIADTCSFIEAAASLSDDGRVLTVQRRQWSLQKPARGRAALPGELLSFEIKDAVARRTAGPMSPISIMHEGVTDEGLRPFELDTLSSFTHNELQPCLLQDGKLSLSLNVSAQADEIRAEFYLCHDLPAGDLVAFVFEKFYGCDQYFCDAHDLADAFYVPTTSSIQILSSNINGTAFHSYAQGTGFALSLPGALPEGTFISVTVAGIVNPMATLGTRHQVKIETQESRTKAPYGRSMPPMVPALGFTLPSDQRHNITFAPGYTSSPSQLSVAMLTARQLQNWYISIEMPADFSIAASPQLLNVGINGVNRTSACSLSVDSTSGTPIVKLQPSASLTLASGSVITFQIGDVRNAPYTHIDRRHVKLEVQYANGATEIFDPAGGTGVDGYQLEAVSLGTVVYGVTMNSTNDETELSVGLTLANAFDFTDTVQVHIDDAFTVPTAVTSVKFISTAVPRTDPLHGIEISSYSGDSDYLVWIEPDGLRYSMGVQFAQGTASQSLGGGSNDIHLTGAAYSGQTVKLLHEYLQDCHSSLPVASCSQDCVHANLTTGVIARLANCTNTSKVSVNKYLTQSSVTIPKGSRLGFSVSGYANPAKTGNYSMEVLLLKVGTTDVMQRGMSSVNPVLQPALVSSNSTASFTKGPGNIPARIRDAGNITLQFIPDQAIPLNSQLKVELPLGERGFSRLDLVSRITVDDVELSFSQEGTTFFIPLTTGYSAASTITVRLEGGVQMPLLAGPSKRIKVVSSLIAGDREMEMALISGNARYRHLKSATSSPRSTASRYGISFDTKNLNHLDLHLVVGSPLHPSDSFAVGFPSSYSLTDPGCSDLRGIWACVSVASCIAGCDGSLQVNVSSMKPVMLGSDLNGTSTVKDFKLILTRSGDGSTVAAGTQIALRLYNFSVPQLNYSFPPKPPSQCVDVAWTDTTGRTCARYSQHGDLCGFEDSVFMCCACGGGNNDGFAVATLSDGYLAEWRALPDFAVTSALFQSVSNSSCGGKLLQPEITLSDSGAGKATYFHTIHFRTTNGVTDTDLIHFEFSTEDIAHDGSEFLLASFSICMHRDGCQMISSVLRFNISAGGNDQTVRMTSRFPQYVTPDTIVKISEVGQGQLTNKLTAARLQPVRLISETADGRVIDSQELEPAFCKDGVATWTVVGENNVSSHLVVSSTSIVAGERTDMTLSISFTDFAVDLPERGYVLVFLPRLFVASTNYSLPPPAPRTQSAPTTTMQEREEIPTITEDVVPDGPYVDPPIYDEAPSIDQRTVLKFTMPDSDTSGDKSKKLEIRLGALTNPAFALGYPPAKGDTVAHDLRLVIQIFAMRPGAVEGPMFWAEWQPVVVPGALSDADREPSSLNAASLVPKLEVRFRVQNAIPADSTFVIQMSREVEITNASRVVDESEGFVFSGTLSSAVVKSDDTYAYLDAPGLCYSSNIEVPELTWKNPEPYCLTNSDCDGSDTCQASNAADADFMIVASRVTSYTNETYLVPVIDAGGMSMPCVLPNALTTEKPGTWIVPSSCDISSPYRNESMQLLYKEDPITIPAGVMLSIFVLNVRAPLKYGLVPKMDVQIMSGAFEGYKSTWLIDRNHQIDLGSVSTGSLTDITVNLLGSVRPFSVGYGSAMQVFFRVPGVMVAASNISLLLHQDVGMPMDSSDLQPSVGVICHGTPSSCPALDFGDVAHVEQVVEVVGNQSFPATKITFMTTNTDDYTDITLNVTLRSIVNPLQGGEYALVRRMKITATQGDKGKDIFLASSEAIPAVSIDPRLQSSDGVASFALTPNRLNSEVNITVSFTARHGVPRSGGIAVRIPGDLTRVEGQHPKAHSVKKKASTDTQTFVNILPLEGCKSTFDAHNQAESMSDDTIIVITCELGATATTFADAGDAFEIRVGPFFTPNRQPPYTTTLFARTISNYALLPGFLDPWDTSTSWGSSESRAIDQFPPYGHSITIMGPLPSLAQFVNATETAVAGEFSSVNISFVSYQSIDGVGNSGGSIRVELPEKFALCRHGDCYSGPSLIECYVLSAVVTRITGYDNQGALTWSLLPTQLRHAPMCIQSQDEVCVRMCDADERISYGTGAPHFIVDFGPTVNPVPAGTKLKLEIADVRMPSRSGPLATAMIELYDGPRATGNLLDSGIFQPQFSVLTRPLPASNIYIAPKNIAVSATSDYTLLFHTAAGVPIGGFIELEFPEGWEIDRERLRVVDAALSGVIKKANGIRLDLNPPASTLPGAYKDLKIHIIQRSSMCEVRAAFNQKRTEILPTEFVWASQPTGGMIAVCQGPLSVGAETLKIIEYTATLQQRSGMQKSAYNYQVVVDRNPSRPATGRTFAISIGRVVPVVCTESPCGRRIRMGPFPWDFPAQSVVNVTIGGIINGPYAESQEATSGPMQLSTFDSDDARIEEGAFKMCGATGDCDGDVLRGTSTSVQIILDAKGAHAQGGFILLVNVINPIRAGSTIRVTFPNTDGNGFLEAQTLHSVSSLTAEDLMDRDDLDLFVTYELIESVMPVEVAVLPCSQYASLSVCSKTVYILVNSTLPKGGLLALHVNGKLRNPNRPGKCSGPCPSAAEEAFDIFKYTMNLYGPPSPSGSTLLQMKNDKVQQNEIVAGEIEAAITRADNETIDQITSVSFTMFSRSGLKADDYIDITIPDPFEFEDGKFPNGTMAYPSDAVQFYSGNASVLNIWGAVKGIRGLLGISEVTSRTVRLRRCDVPTGEYDQTLDVPITFTLWPIRNRDYGSVNYRGDEIPAGFFTVKLYDNTDRLIEEQRVDSPPIRPAWLGVTAVLGTNRSATLTTVDLSFQLSRSLLTNDEIFVFLPKGYSVYKGQAVARVSVHDTTVQTYVADIELERVMDPVTQVMQRATVRIAANAPLPSGRTISVAIDNIFTPVGGERRKDVFIVSTASYGCGVASQHRNDKSWEGDVPTPLSERELVSRPPWVPRLGNWPESATEANAVDYCYWIMETNLDTSLCPCEVGARKDGRCSIDRTICQIKDLVYSAGMEQDVLHGCSSALSSPPGDTVLEYDRQHIPMIRGILSTFSTELDQVGFVCLSDTYGTSSVDIDAGDISLSSVEVGISTKVAGNQVVVSATFTTRNPFPRDGTIVITLPEGYRAEREVKPCSAVLGQHDLSCPLPCSPPLFCPKNLRPDPEVHVLQDGAVVTIRNTDQNVGFQHSDYDLFPSRELVGQGPYVDELMTPGYKGLQIAINISSIRLREASSQNAYEHQISSPDVFRLEIRDETGRPVDRTYIGVSSPPLKPNNLTMVSVMPLTMAEMAEQTLAIRFKTFNSLIRGGLIRLKLPKGYAFDKSTLSVIRVQSTLLDTELNMQDGGPLDGLQYLADFSSGPGGNETVTGELWFRLPDDRDLPSDPQRLTFFVSPVKTTEEVVDSFELSTLTPEREVIDQDLHVLSHYRVPGLLAETSVKPSVVTAGAMSDIVVMYKTSSTLSPDSPETVIAFPPTYKFLKPDQSNLPVKSIHVNGVCQCSNSSADACSNRCADATFRSAPAPIPEVRAVSPVASYSDSKQRVTVYGSNFDGHDVRAKLAETMLPVVLVRDNLVVVEVDCSEELRANNTFCGLKAPGGINTERKCERSVGWGETFNETKCGDSTVGEQRVGMTWTGPIELSVSHSGYPSYGHFTDSNINYTVYRRLMTACPNDCSDRGVCSTIASGTGIVYLCKCRYPFEGIDCRSGPTVMAIKPDFGSLTGGDDVQVQIFTGVPLSVAGKTYRCIFGTRIVTASLMPDLMTLRCVVPPKSVLGPNATDTVPVYITLNQGSTCEKQEGQKVSCCYTDSPDGCFRGEISHTPRYFTYFDSSSLQTGAFVATEELGANAHAHIFNHTSHDSSDRPHAHMITSMIGGKQEFYIARSLTVDRDCDCGRGDYDCACTSVQGSHMHVYVHKHDFSGDPSHSHDLQLRTPALALPAKLPALDAKRELDDQIAVLYAIGARDITPEFVMSSIVELKQAEERLVKPVSTEVVVPMPTGVLAGSAVRIILSEEAEIQVRASAGPTDTHGIMTVDRANLKPCKQVARMCAGIVDRDIAVDSFEVLPSFLDDLKPVQSAVYAAGSVTSLTFTMTAKNAIPSSAGRFGKIQIHMPQIYSMNSTTRLEADECLTATAACTSGLHNPSNISLVLSSQSSCFPTPEGSAQLSMPCELESQLCAIDPYAAKCQSASNFVEIRLNHVVDAKAQLIFTLTDVLLPPFSGNSSNFKVSTFGADGFKIDEKMVKGLEIAPGQLRDPFVQLTNFEVGGNASIVVQFVLANPIPVNGKCRLRFDGNFDVTNVEVVSTSDTNWTISDTYQAQEGGGYLDLILVDPAGMILEVGREIGFEIVGLTNPVKLGFVQGFRIVTLLPGTVGGVCHVSDPDVDACVIDEATSDGFYLLAAKIDDLDITLDQYHTGSYGPLQISSRLPLDLKNGSTIVITTPAGFQPCVPHNKSSLVISSSQCSFTSEVSFDPNPCDANLAQFEVLEESVITISFQEDCTVRGGTPLEINISSIINPVFDGLHGNFELRTLHPACGEGSCMVHEPLDRVKLIVNEMLTVGLQMEGEQADLSYTTGQPLRLIKVNVTTLNRLPDRAYLVVDVPRHFTIDESRFVVRLSSGRGGSGWQAPGCSCPSQRTAMDSCCPYGNFFFFEVPERLEAGSSLQFEVEGISNRLAAGDAYFQIRTAELNVSASLFDGRSTPAAPNWVFLDRAIAKVDIQAANLASLSIEVQAAIDFGIDEGLHHTQSYVNTSIMRTGMVADLRVSFVTVNVIRHRSKFVMLFGDGFDLREAFIDIGELPGYAEFLPPTDVLTLDWLNKTSIEPGTPISFVMRNVLFPASRQGELPHLGIRTISELGNIVHEDLDVYGMALEVGKLRHLQAIAVPSTDEPYVRFNQSFVLNVSFAFASTFYADSSISIQFNSSTFTVKDAYIASALCIQQQSGSNLRYIKAEGKCSAGGSSGSTTAPTSHGSGAYLDVPTYDYSSGSNPPRQTVTVQNATGGRQLESGAYFWVLISGIHTNRLSTFEDTEIALVRTFNSSADETLDESAVVLQSYLLGVTRLGDTSYSAPFDLTDKSIVSLQNLLVSDMIAFPFIKQDEECCFNGVPRVTQECTPSNLNKAGVKFMWRAGPLRVHANMFGIQAGDCSELGGTEGTESVSVGKYQGMYLYCILPACTGQANTLVHASVQYVGCDGICTSIARAPILVVPAPPSNVVISASDHGTIRLDWDSDDENQILYYELQVTAEVTSLQTWVDDLFESESDWPLEAITWPTDDTGVYPGQKSNIVMDSTLNNGRHVIHPCCAGGKSCCGLSTKTFRDPSYLTSGRVVYARLRAVSSAYFRTAYSVWSEVKNITAIGQPSPPILVSRAHTDSGTGASGVVLFWSVPADMGLGKGIMGSGLASLTNFEVEMKNVDTASAWELIAFTAPNATRHFEPLSNNTLYSFRVRGLNLLGPGKWSSPVSFRAFVAPHAAATLDLSVIYGADMSMRVQFDSPQNTGYGDETANLTSLLVEQYVDSAYRPCCNDDRLSQNCGAQAEDSGLTETLSLDASFRLSAEESTAVVACSGCDCRPSSGRRAGSITGIVNRYMASEATECTWLIAADSDISLRFSSVNLTAEGAERLLVYQCTDADCGDSAAAGSNRTLVVALDVNNTVNGVPASYLPAYVSETNFIQIVLTSEGHPGSEQDRSYFAADWTLATARLSHQVLDDGGLQYAFDVSGLQQGRAYRYRILLANEYSYARTWSPLSLAVQAQGRNMPRAEFLAEDQGVVLGNFTYTLQWAIPSSASSSRLQDFRYRVRQYSDPQYPFPGSINVQPNQAVDPPNHTDPMDFNELTLDGFASFQHVRTWGAVDLTFLAAGGEDYVAFANSKTLGHASNPALQGNNGEGFLSDKASEAIENWGFIGKDMEALVLYKRNATSGAFGGACQYVHTNPAPSDLNVKTDCLGDSSKTFCQAVTSPTFASYQNMLGYAKQDHCSGFVDPPYRAYQFDTNDFLRSLQMNTAVITKMNVHQMISTYGASAVKTFTIDGETYIMVANTRIPKFFMCVEAGTESPYENHLKYRGGIPQGDGTPGTSRVEWKNVRQCLHWNDTATCATDNENLCPTEYRPCPTRCVGFPADSSPADNSALYTQAHSVLYRFNPFNSEFYMHQAVAIDRPRALATFISESSQIALPLMAASQEGDGGVRLFAMQASDCSGYIIGDWRLGRDDLTGFDEVTEDLNAKCLSDLQTIPTEQVSAILLFDALEQEADNSNETLLVLTHTFPVNVSDPSVNAWGPGSVYVWSNGAFAQHPTAFRTLPTDGALCLEHVKIDGRHLVVICQSRACSADWPGGPVQIPDQDQGYIDSDGRCTAVYEVRSPLSIRLSVNPSCQCLRP